MQGQDRLVAGQPLDACLALMKDEQRAIAVVGMVEPAGRDSFAWQGALCELRWACTVGLVGDPAVSIRLMPEVAQDTFMIGTLTSRAAWEAADRPLSQRPLSPTHPKEVFAPWKPIFWLLVRLCDPAPI